MTKTKKEGENLKGLCENRAFINGISHFICFKIAGYGIKRNYCKECAKKEKIETKCPK